MQTMDDFGKARLPRRFLKRWWRKQSLAQQDSFATLAPLTSVLLFLAAMVLAFWVLRNQEFERERESVERDTELVQQQLRLRLIDDQSLLSRLAHEVASRTVELQEFPTRAAALARERPELAGLYWVNAARVPVAAYASAARSEAVVEGEEPAASVPFSLRGSAASAAFNLARTSHQPAYAAPLEMADGSNVWQIALPLIDRGNFKGALVADYALDALLHIAVPAEVAKRHTIGLSSTDGRALASTAPLAPGQKARPAAIVHEVPVTPADGSLLIRGQGHRSSIGLVSSMLFWMVAALSALTVWMLLGTLRHMRGRLQIQSALVSETNFRRAMENSMLTGMRAMDLTGCITYVNPAFCAMTGFSEVELVGQMPPFPHWPADKIEENTRLLNQELQGLSPVGGIEMKMMRKDATLFDARVYVSPLIDSRGQQTGWMTSLTNITEAKRIRDQLTASHERFTMVLEGLDASVSVLSVQQRELLFANHSYRLWFGAESLGHDLLAGDDPGMPAPGEADDSVDNFGGLPTQALTQLGSQPNEVFIESLQKWFDVRARYLQWTDGRLAQMLIATDVTSRRAAETAAAHQAEKAQVTSRLMTMGEMASSVAHELNQPLTAITNYCNGMVSRVQNDAIAKPDLIAALEKTSRQAQRAGQIIHRIRAFVKRSEPQRQASRAKEIVDDAVELAGIELRRRNVTIRTYVAQRLPVLMVDPILIEQVLLNLLKNAAEAIDMAKLPVARRNIELRVVPRHTAEEGDVIEFSVTDKGPGLEQDVLNRLYEAFFSTKADGLGIGLSLCRSIIESHRGRIGAQNIYNGHVAVGCRFAFTLPVEPEPERGAPRPTARSALPTTAATTATTTATTATAP